MSSPLDSQTALHTSPDHLTDDQIDDLLIGDLAPEPAAHLAACDLCIARVAQASEPLASFDSVSLAWSQRRSSTLPLPDRSRQIPLLLRQISWVPTTFVFVLGLALLNTTHQLTLRTSELQPSQIRYNSPDPTQASARPNSPAPQAFEASIPHTQPTTAATPRPAQISADNQILEAVDDELDASMYNPAALGIESVSTQDTPSPTITTLQD